MGQLQYVVSIQISIILGKKFLHTSCLRKINHFNYLLTVRAEFLSHPTIINCADFKAILTPFSEII